jgi:AraC family transcriptional regulator
MQLAWPGLRAEYAWLPPFHGRSPTQPNRIEVVFSAHPDVALELTGRVHDVKVEPGGMYVVGVEPTTLLTVNEYSDTLEMYPDMALLRAHAAREGLAHFALEPSMAAGERATFQRDAGVLAVAHLLRRACMGQLSLSDLAADSLAHLLARRILLIQRGIDVQASSARASRFSARALANLCDYIESRLFKSVTLDELARAVQLSPFHFARSFKLSTGLAPHQYLLARRIDWVKNQIMATNLPVRDLAWAVGFENLSHFRRQFVKQIGVLPTALRQTKRCLAR